MSDVKKFIGSYDCTIFKGLGTLTNMELEELIREEENTLCSMPYEPQYKERRQALTGVVMMHRDMLCRQIKPLQAQAYVVR